MLPVQYDHPPQKKTIKEKKEKRQQLPIFTIILRDNANINYYCATKWTTSNGFVCEEEESCAGS